MNRHWVGGNLVTLLENGDAYFPRVFECIAAAESEVLLETFYRGRSVAEAATVLGIPAGTVKSRSFYALRALRLVLEEWGWEQ